MEYADPIKSMGLVGLHDVAVMTFNCDFIRLTVAVLHKTGSDMVFSLIYHFSWTREKRWVRKLFQNLSIKADQDLVQQVLLVSQG